jgi:hypothetical protein
VRDVIDFRWAPYVAHYEPSLPWVIPLPGQDRSYGRMERHTYQELEWLTYFQLEEAPPPPPGITGGETGAIDTRDHEWVRFVVVMQPGLPRRTLQALVPTG